jgi:flagellar basal body rod protein FlgC
MARVDVVSYGFANATVRTRRVQKYKQRAVCINVTTDKPARIPFIEIIGIDIESFLLSYSAQWSSI